MKRSALKRRTGLRPIGAKAVRERDALAAFRAALRDRSYGLCELATPACPPGPHDGHHAHHRAPSDRDRGVHDPGRGLFLCFPGHAWVHRHPEEARRRGWLLHDGDAMRRCPTHHRPLTFDESYRDSVPDGLGPLGTERTFTITRFACPEPGCGQYVEEES